MTEQHCPHCTRPALTLDKTYSLYRYRCDKQQGGCGWRIDKWHREQDDALALLKLICWQIRADRLSGTLTLKGKRYGR